MIEIGTLLYTKDGRRIGNGIITQVDFSPTGVKRFAFETDYGHDGILSEEKLFEYFHVNPDKHNTIRGWREGRLSRIFLKRDLFDEKKKCN